MTHRSSLGMLALVACLASSMAKTEIIASRGAGVDPALASSCLVQALMPFDVFDTAIENPDGTFSNACKLDNPAVYDQSDWLDGQDQVESLMIAFSDVLPISSNPTVMQALADFLNQTTPGGQRKFRVYLNGAGALFLQAPWRQSECTNNGQSWEQRDIDTLAALYEYGVPVEAVMLQSVLSKPLVGPPANTRCEFTEEQIKEITSLYESPATGLDARLVDIDTYTRKIRYADPEFFDIEFGLIDASPAVFDREQIQWLNKRFDRFCEFYDYFTAGWVRPGDMVHCPPAESPPIARSRILLKRILLDAPLMLEGGIDVTNYEYIADALEISQYRGARVGISINRGNLGNTSDLIEYEGSMLYLSTLDNAIGLDAFDDHWLLGFGAFPTNTLPEATTSGPEVHTFFRFVRDAAAVLDLNVFEQVSPIGELSFSGCTIEGWACDLNNPGEDLVISIREVGNMTPDQVIARQFGGSQAAQMCGGVSNKYFSKSLHEGRYRVFGLDVDITGNAPAEPVNTLLSNGVITVPSSCGSE